MGACGDQNLGLEASIWLGGVVGLPGLAEFPELRKAVPSNPSAAGLSSPSTFHLTNASSWLACGFKMTLYYCYHWSKTEALGVAQEGKKVTVTSSVVGFCNRRQLRCGRAKTQELFIPCDSEAWGL